MRQNINTLIAIGLIALGPGCSGDDEDSPSTPIALTSVENVTAGSECPSGGVRVNAGGDDNGNGSLDPVEVDSSAVVCAGENGSAGLDGTGARVETRLLEPDEQCPFGGTEVVAGSDADGSGTLEPTEVTSTQRLCNTQLEAFDGLFFTSNDFFGDDPALYQVSRTGPPIRRDSPAAAQGSIRGAIRSPDGRSVAYAVRDGFNQNYYRTLSALNLERPVDSFRMISESARVGATFSPDSSRLLYALNDVLETPSGLAVGRVDGTLGAVIAEPSGSREFDAAEFSADSRRIAYSIESELVVVDRNGRDPVALPTASPGGVGEFAWSPTEPRLAFVRSGDLYLYLPEEDGGDEEVLNEGATSTLAWAPDGSRLSFLDGPFNSRSLFTVLTEEEKPVPINGTLDADETILLFLITGDVWSATGRLLYVRADPTFRRLISAEPDGSDRRTLVDDLSTATSVSLRAQWSPDGNRVAYMRGETATPTKAELFTVSADGTGRQKVNGELPAEGNVSSYQWSPDSAFVAYLADQDVDGIVELYVSPAAGGASIKLNETPAGMDNVESFFWSPDSALVAYVTNADGEGGSELYLVAPDGTGRRKVSGDLAVDAFVSW